MRFFTKAEFRIFLIFWIIFSVFATSDRWNDNASLDLTMAIVDEHRFEIDSYANNTGDRAYYKGHYYSDKVPGTAFLAVPLYSAYETFVGKIPYYNSLDEDNPSWKYQLFLFLAISLISAVCGSLTIVLVYKISRYFTSNNLHRNLMIIVLGLGTLIPHAGRQFNSHAISTFFIFLSFYLVFKMKKEKTDYSLFAGLAGGFAVLVEYRVIIILTGLLIIILTLKKWRWILKFVIGASVFYLILLSYTYAIYDSPFSAHTRYADESIWNEVIAKESCGALQSARSPLATVYSSFIKSFEYQFKRPQKRVIIRVTKLLFDPFKGLLFYSPIMLLSLLGLFWMYKKYKIETLVIIVCLIIYIFHLSSPALWWMGLSFGPRHLTPFIPFFMIPLLHAFKKISIRIVLFFITISVLISIIGLQPVILSHDPIVFSDSYCEKMRSFAPLANPLFSNYIPSLLSYNPIALHDQLVIERLLNIKIIPFANIFLLLLSFLLIWKNDLIFKN